LENKVSADRFDVMIAGAGLVGLTLGLALEKHGLTVCVIDPLDITKTHAQGFDGRHAAIASASARMLKAIGIWDFLEGQHQRINEIRVTDNNHPLFLNFDRVAEAEEPLGYLVENRLMRRAQLDAAKNAKNLTLLTPDSFSDINYNPESVCATLTSGREIKAPLLVACDGRTSKLRARAGIRISQWAYKQIAIATTVAHELPHGGVAHELFLRDEPFAILPIIGTPEHPHRSNLVWIVPEARASAYLGLGPIALQAEIQKRFGDFLGTIQLTVPVWSYPLGYLHAETYHAHRFVLAGDSAHGIHPIAGQGLNLGMRDVAALTQILVEGARLGLDLGDPSLLGNYTAARHSDNARTAFAMDAIVRLFDAKSPPIKLARKLGLGMVNRSPALKRFFSAQARGQSASASKLLRGELV
jgi:2-octaprenyl-6-methoxyphenol hydroxylase